ncbi:MAG: 3-deoxy-manno-octulosonate cytidylyltransferase, partial [Bacteroidales bacterium]|nr:3-deoxy-manno-octulosonate cytidylyltransferase [Bacteroidales bacterium]
ARYASTRFPGKPLAMIAGRSMIRRVLDQAERSGVFDAVAVATDDERILQHVLESGSLAVMTSTEHTSGTSRCMEAMDSLSRERRESWDVVVNIQGDEPFIDPEDLRRVTLPFQDPSAQIATLICPIRTLDELTDPNVVKVVSGARGQALYFSRSPIPYVREYPLEHWLEAASYFRHIGIYAYSSLTLRQLCELAPAMAEQAESLEQLRWLASGYIIEALLTHRPGLGVDTPADLERAERMARGTAL